MQKFIALAVINLVMLTGIASSPSALASATIHWKVENPFRLFTDSRDTALHREAYEALKLEERATPILSTERALAKRHPAGWAADLIKRVCWDEKSNRYRCRKQKNYINPTHHSTTAHVEWDGFDVDPEATCIWRLRPSSARGRSSRRRGRRRRKMTRAKNQTIKQRCSLPVTLRIPYPDGANLTVTSGNLELAKTSIAVNDLLIVGLGDSFGSGEGNPDSSVRFSRERSVFYGRLAKNQELSGYPARVGAWRHIGDRKFIKNGAVWLDQACHRSLYSHQLRAALQLAIESPHRAVTFLGYACSGAEITNGLFIRYKGNEWGSTSPDLSQISAVSQSQCGNQRAPAKDYPEAYHMRGGIPDLQGGLVLHKCPRGRARKIDLVMLSVGGNDIGFARLVANAILQERSTLKRLGGWFGQVYGKSDTVEPLRQLKARYRSLKRALHNILYIPWAESDRIILTGYPGIALLKDEGMVCPSGRAGMEVLSEYALNHNRARDGEEVAERLHKMMRRQARRHGWRFAESHRKAFLGRSICAGGEGPDTAIANDLRFPRKVGGLWRPYNPADFRPYAQRRRWFRTPNDAFLTGNFHATSRLLKRVLRRKRLLWTQVLLASIYSGAFHPTAEGQAAIADSVAEQARLVLERYGQDGAGE